MTISRDGSGEAELEIAASFVSGKQKGKQAGVWKPLDARVQLIPGAVDQVLTFVQHNLTGSRVSTTGANTWTIDWTAPTSDRARPVQRRRQRVSARIHAARLLTPRGYAAPPDAVQQSSCARDAFTSGFNPCHPCNPWMIFAMFVFGVVA